MATPSIQYISQLLEEPYSVSDTDADNIDSLIHVFPYFLPARYIDAALQHKKRAFGAPMMTGMQLYMGNWLLFSEFLELAGSQSSDKGRVVPKLSIKKPEIVEKFPLYDEEFNKGTDVFPADKSHEPFVPKEAIQDEHPVSVHVHYTPLEKEHDTHINYTTPIPAETETNPVSEDQDITVPDAFEEADMLQTVGDADMPVEGVELQGAAQEQAEMQVNETEEQETQETEDISVEEDTAEESEIADEAELQAAAEEEVSVTGQVTYEAQQNEDVVMEYNITEKVEEEPYDNTRYIIEQISIPGSVREEQKEEESMDENKMIEEVTDTLDALREDLISPIYTDDYFRHQGIDVSNEIPEEIKNTGRQAEEKSGMTTAEEDKSLMVMMSFSEWLMRLKESNQKEKEEQEDKKALKTMWQKEKLAAAIEEGNDEIPEKVFEMAVNSITKEENLVSEALAEIYVKQGKYDTAIEMYRKLSLRNPQKNAYFARKIEEILKAK